MRFFNDGPVSGILFIYLFIRSWSFCISRSMLNVILRSSTGKKSSLYVKNATRIQRLYGFYIPLVTRYRHRLSKYLAMNNIVSALFSGFIVVLFLVNEITPYETGCIMEYSLLLAVLLLCAPPIVVTYIQTSYNGGHPHYWFDLEADFIGPKAQNRKRLLLNEKRNSIIFTPDEFSNKKQQN